MKNNLFPASLHEIKACFWTGNGQQEIHCDIADVAPNKIVVHTDAVMPKLGENGIFWRPFSPIFPGVVTEVAGNRFTAELGELSAEAKNTLAGLVASRQGAVIPIPRPPLLKRVINKALFMIEQSLPDIHRRTFSPAEFPWSLDFEREWKVIRSEVENIFKHVDVTEIPLGPDQLVNWHSVLIAQQRRSTDEARKLLPNTSRLVDAVPSLLNADLSILRPGAEIKYHKANSRVFLRMHLGIIVPKGNICLQLEDEQLRWKEGEVMIFDDFYPHAAWNRTEETRVILLVDFIRPMPKWKETIIRMLHPLTAGILPNIPAHWLRW